MVKNRASFCHLATEQGFRNIKYLSPCLFLKHASQFNNCLIWTPVLKLLLKSWFHSYKYRTLDDDIVTTTCLKFVHYFSHSVFIRSITKSCFKDIVFLITLQNYLHSVVPVHKVCSRFL